MRAIHKGAEPQALGQYRTGVDLSDEHAYENFPQKGVLRAQLVTEQRGLCAFCGARIVNDPLKMKIAHWKPRLLEGVTPDGDKTYPNLPNQLDYWNLLGACKGNEGQPPPKQHCDTHQGNSALTKNPADPAHQIEEIISFLTDGSIASSDAQFNQELGRKKGDEEFERGVLNLNLPFIRNNRKAALDGFKEGLKKRGSFTKAQIEKLVAEWRGDAEGELRPYAPVVAFWLRKRLARELH
jgi:uncharacterized protein (TIGR02646 family)